MKVMVAILHMGSISVQVAKTLLFLQQDRRHELEIVFNSDVPGESNRNRIIKQFLKTKNQYLLMIDDDNAPRCNPLDLVDRKIDILGFPTPVFKDGQLSWNVAKLFPEGYRFYQGVPGQMAKDGLINLGLMRVDGVGSGCLLVHRRVLEAIPAPFMREWDGDGVAVVGQDIAFCKRATAMGFEIYTHWLYPCSHQKEVDLFDFYGLPRR